MQAWIKTQKLRLWSSMTQLRREEPVTVHMFPACTHTHAHLQTHTHTLGETDFVEMFWVFLVSRRRHAAGVQRAGERLLWGSVPVISGLNPARSFPPQMNLPRVKRLHLRLSGTTWQQPLRLIRISDDWRHQTVFWSSRFGVNITVFHWFSRTVLLLDWQWTDKILT